MGSLAAAAAGLETEDSGVVRGGATRTLGTASEPLPCGETGGRATLGRFPLPETRGVDVAGGVLGADVIPDLAGAEVTCGVLGEDLTPEVVLRFRVGPCSPLLAGRRPAVETLRARLR